MIEAPARIRIDVCCNDPDNGLFAGRAHALQVNTWDGELIEIELRHERSPIFRELPGAIRAFRRDWPILASKDWLGNWCWNAYWLTPSVAIELLAAAKRSGFFSCGVAPTQLFEDWNESAAPLNRDLWAANLWGRHAIGEAAKEGGG